MTAVPDQAKRRLLPRWQPFSATAHSGELRSVTARVTLPPCDTAPGPDEFLEQKLAEWTANPSVAVAVDVLSSAVATGNASKFEAIGWWLLNQRENIAPAVVQLAEFAALGDGARRRPASSTVVTTQALIGQIRRIASDNPRDSVLYVDMALAHAMLGNLEAARRAIVVATQLAPDNRFVLRSAARFWIHYGDADRARAILLRSQRTKVDPWLMAAELAISSFAEKPARYVKAGHQLISDRFQRPAHVSELAGALGTLEQINGSRRSAKRLFLQSLIEPTENALAQAVWAMRQGVALDLRSDDGIIAKSNEPLTWLARMRLDWDVAIAACRRWAEEERFATIPAELGSFMSAVFGDFEAASQFAKDGLTANPNHFMLNNNFAVAELCLDHIEIGLKLIGHLKGLARTEEHKIFILATSGLAEFRRGHISDGRALYKSAVKVSDTLEKKRLATFASAFWALEELRAGTDEAAVAIAEFENLSPNLAEPEVTQLKKRLGAAKRSTQEVPRRAVNRR